MNEQLIARFKAVSEAQGIALTTLGRYCGQGGHFWKRLNAGSKVTPRIVAEVMQRLDEIETGVPQ
jgi:hypothetical protein